MRIVQVSVGTARIPPKVEGAPLQVIFNTSKHLVMMGHDVVILDRKYSKDDSSRELIEGVQIVRMKVAQGKVKKVPRFVSFVLAELNAVLFALSASAYLKRNGSKIDIINIHLTSTGLIVCILNKKLRDRMFYTCHMSQWVFAGNRLGIAERVHLLLDSYVMRRVKKVIALSDTAKQNFMSVGKVKEDAIVVIPNGVDTDFFYPSIEMEEEVKKRYGLAGKMIVLFVGRIAKIKGVEHLVGAADIIVNKFGYKDTLFVLVGSHSYAGVDQPVNIVELLENIRQRQLEKNIKLTGPVTLDEVRALYPICDIFVLPSLAEGDPLVVVEAMASGKPIIGTKVGGIPHKVRDGWNGFLIDPGSERQLVDSIRYLIDHPEERQRMGENSRKYAEEQFDWRKVAEKLLLAYSIK